MKQQTAVQWLMKMREKYGAIILTDLVKAKAMERENASTFGIRVTSECCTLKNGKIEVDLQKFETLLSEMYGE